MGRRHLGCDYRLLQLKDGLVRELSCLLHLIILNVGNLQAHAKSQSRKTLFWHCVRVASHKRAIVQE